MKWWDEAAFMYGIGRGGWVGKSFKSRKKKVTREAGVVSKKSITRIPLEIGNKRK